MVAAFVGIHIILLVHSKVLSLTVLTVRDLAGILTAPLSW